MIHPTNPIDTRLFFTAMPPIRPTIEKKSRKIAKPMLNGNAIGNPVFIQIAIEATTSRISIVVNQYMYAILQFVSQYDSVKRYSKVSSVDKNLPCIAAADDDLTFICTLDVI